MPRRVDARDVLDADAVVARGFRGRIAGVFRRSGPNTWDDYVYRAEDGGAIQVLAGTEVQLESEGAAVRMRRQGQVVTVQWTPEPGQVVPGDDLRARFLECCLRQDDPTPDGNLARWLHGELQPKRDVND